jgi:putative ABC transport system permease protein
MGFLESFAIALDAILANKLRSFLTMLGVIIGVFAITVMISFGEGIQSRFMEAVEEIGSNLLIIIPGKKEVEEEHMGGQSIRFKSTVNRMRASDAVLITRACPSVAAAAPNVEGMATLTHGNNEFDDGRFEATTGSYLEVRKPKLASGRFFSQEEAGAGLRVAVIGSKVKDRLFTEGESPIGKKIRLRYQSGTVPFRVIGVLKESGGMFGSGEDKRVVIPLPCGQEIYDTRRVFAIYALARAHDEVEAAQEQITRVLKERHGEKDFDFLTMKEISSMVTGMLTTFKIVLGLIASVSLVVGGIGIMNIMLASVTERTREIGIRKAVGARARNILLQFVVEAAALSILGGAIGIALGYLAAAGVTARWPEDFPCRVTAFTILIATGFAAFVGILFGAWPAWRASKLDPIVALRYE